MRKTYLELFELNQFAGSWLKKNEGESKMSYAIKKIGKRLKTIFEYYNEKINEIGINNCSVDDKQNIIKDEKGELVFTKENLIKKNKESKALLSTEVEIEPYICTEIPELTEEEKEVFEGILI